ncbi:MAG: hypothetical protein KJ749_04470 [Planctomycetes bacterium]|nr:hypothetical protein [Planctomycetota bacterium]
MAIPSGSYDRELVERFLKQQGIVAPAVISAPRPVEQSFEEQLLRCHRIARRRPIVLRVLGLIGYVIAVCGYFLYPTFDPNAAFAAQPHAWLLLAIYLANPRALALYYLACAQPPVDHWAVVLLAGFVFVPGAWGLYVLPGLSAAMGLRLGLCLAGFLLRDFGLNIWLSARNLSREWDISAVTRRVFFSTVTVSMVCKALVCGGLLYAVCDTRVETVFHTTIKVREDVAQELGFGSHHEMMEALGAAKPVYRFWPGVTEQDERSGYLMSENYIPLRAIAARPNVSMFEGYERVSPAGVTGVVGTMRVWQPYFVFERRENAVLIGESLNMESSEARWAPIGLCFCWTTRECLNIEEDIPTYGSLEEARADTDGTNGSPYRYSYGEHFITDPALRDVATFRMAALPVLDRREGIYWCIAKTEGDVRGYQTCWIKWDGKDERVVLRFRTTRIEFERYLNGILALERSFREAHLLGKGVDYVMGAELSESSDLSRTKKRLEGIPKIVGYLEQPPESMEEYQQLKQKVLRLLEVSSAVKVWDVNEVAYLMADLVF